MTNQKIRTMTLRAISQADGRWLQRGRTSLNLGRKQSSKTGLDCHAHAAQLADKFFPSADEGRSAQKEFERMLLRRI